MAFTAEKAFELLESAHQKNRLAHAFLITGQSGSGKEDLAAKIIQLVNPPEDEGGGVDLFGEAADPAVKNLNELEGEWVRIVRPRSKSRRIPVDDMRDLEKSFHVASGPGKWKVGVILNADRMGVEAANAFLKTLEEPPRECLLLLVSDAPELMLPTILSRCVRLPLIAGSGQHVMSQSCEELLASLASMARQGMGSVQAALTLRVAFSSILARRRAEIAKRNEDTLKEENKKYKNTTDSDKWLEDREKFYLANTESEYLNEREKLIDVLVSWMGDVVRLKCGVNMLDFPGEEKTTKGVAQAHDLADLLARMEGIEELRGNLETNVQEQLALEVALLTTFG